MWLWFICPASHLCQGPPCYSETSPLWLHVLFPKAAHSQWLRQVGVSTWGCPGTWWDSRDMIGFNVFELPPGGWACIPAELCWTYAPDPNSLCFLFQAWVPHQHLGPQTSIQLCCCSIMEDALQPHGLQQARHFCPPLSPSVCSNSCPLSCWCCQTISSTQHCFPNPNLLYRPSSLTCFPPFYKFIFLPLELGISFSPKGPCRWRSKYFPVFHPSSCLNGGISGSHGPWVVRTALWTSFRSGHVNDHTAVRSDLWQGYFCLALYSTLMLLSPKVTRGWGWLVGAESILCRLKQNPASSQCLRGSYGDPD